MADSYDSGLIDAFDDAQRRGWRMLSELCSNIVVGMSEADIDAAARDLLSSHGFDRWYHAPEIAVGERTARPPHRASSRARVKDGDLVSVDLGPSGADAYADVGVTLFIGGGEAPELLSVARECARGCVGYASQWKTVGEIFVFARAWCTNHRMTLASTRSIGHAILPKEGYQRLGFPKSAHAANLLRRNQIHFLHPVRVRGMWAVRPLVSDGEHAASFEEIFFVDGDEKRILGRADISEVGTLPAL